MLDTETDPVGLGPTADRRLSLGELRVLVVGTAGDYSAIARAIELSGHALAAHVTTADQAMAIASAHQCNAVLISVPFDDSGLELCAKLQLLGPMPVILVGDPIDPLFLQNAEGAGVVGCVGHGASVAMLSSALTLGATWFRVCRRLQGERDDLAAQNRKLILTLENRKLIEKAKGIYMRVHNLQEADAHRRLQMESQKRRLGLAELARKIIESDELLGH